MASNGAEGISGVGKDPAHILVITSVGRTGTNNGRTGTIRGRTTGTNR
jgi:hypothetical protein